MPAPVRLAPRRPAPKTIKKVKTIKSVKNFLKSTNIKKIVKHSNFGKCPMKVLDLREGRPHKDDRLRGL